MTADPRVALAQLVSALERHLEVATVRRDPDDPAVIAAAETLAEAFDDYDEALFEATEVATPLAVYGDDDDDDDEVDAHVDQQGDTAVYSGLDDEDIDFDDDADAEDDADDSDDDDDDDDEDADDEDADDDDADDDDDDADDDEDGPERS